MRENDISVLSGMSYCEANYSQHISQFLTKQHRINKQHSSPPKQCLMCKRQNIVCNHLNTMNKLNVIGKRQDKVETETQSRDSSPVKRPKVVGDDSISIRCQDPPTITSSDFSLISVDIFESNGNKYENKTKVEKAGTKLKDFGLTLSCRTQNLEADAKTLNGNVSSNSVELFSDNAKDFSSPFQSSNESIDNLGSMGLGNLYLNSQNHDSRYNSTKDLTSESVSNSYECSDSGLFVGENFRWPSPAPVRRAILDKAAIEERKKLLTAFVDGDENTALHKKILDKRETEAISIIKEATGYEDLNVCNWFDQTPLHLAVLTGQPNIVRKLVTAGAWMTYRDSNGNTPLHLACERGESDIVKHLVTPIEYNETLDNCYDVPVQAIPQNMALKNDKGEDCKTIADRHKNQEVYGILLDLE